MKIALGPLLYYWPRETIFEFYESMLTAPVDVVYLGETVCSRRRELNLADWTSIAQRWQAAGKEVVLSTQVLIESGSDVSKLHKIAAQSIEGGFRVEANDMGAVHCLEGKVPFIAGPHLNIYNAPTLQWMAQLGLQRWVMPMEMGRDDLAVLQRERPQGLQTEVFAFGRMPLAFSARCFTARHYNLPKDDCQFSCIQHPEGMMMRTREGEGFLVLNGTQTQSARFNHLIDQLDTLHQMGVDVLRISPQPEHTATIVKAYRDVLNHPQALSASQATLQSLMPGQTCNGYWFGKPGMEQSEAIA